MTWVRSVLTVVTFKRGVGLFQGASFKVSYYISEPIWGMWDIAEYENWLWLNSNQNSYRAQNSSSLSCAHFHSEPQSTRPGQPLFPDTCHLSGSSERGPTRDTSTDQSCDKQHGLWFFCCVLFGFLLKYMMIDKTTNFLGPILKSNLIAEYLRLKRILPSKVQYIMKILKISLYKSKLVLPKNNIKNMLAQGL